MFWNLFWKEKFIDKNWNFINIKFLRLLNDSKYALETWKKPSFLVKKEAKQIIIGWVKDKEVWSFINKLSNFLNSWIDIKMAFSIISKQLKNPRLRFIVNETRINLDHGLSISDTLKQYSKYFDPLIIALIEVWEKTWSLPKVLSELDKRLLETIELKSKIKWALIYPVILLIITLVMVVFMMTFIVPKIVGSFEKSWVEIPALTKFLINISNFMVNHYLFLFIILIWSVIFFIFFKKTYLWKLFFWYISLKIPVFWKISLQENIILFINSFTLLLDSWVLMLEALTITANVVPNIYFKKDIIRIKNEVETGIKLSGAMWLNSHNKETFFYNQYFPEELVYMVSVWEEAGTISKTIEKIWNTYSKELKRYITNLMAALEPFIIVFIWSIVWVVVIAIMLPFFNLAKVAKKL